MSGVANVGAAGSAMTTDFSCFILGDRSATLTTAVVGARDPCTTRAVRTLGVLANPP
ncbi:unnamed protein product, partial [Ectocarpus sp. 12 AP-2014]